jgi:hypothetical protein
MRKSGSPLPQVALLLAIDTTAVLLSVKPQLLGDTNPLLPTTPVIIIVEAETILETNGFAQLTDLIMPLIAAVEEGGSEGIKAPLLCSLGRSFQSRSIAITATLLWLRGNSSEELLQSVVVLEDKRQ